MNKKYCFYTLAKKELKDFPDYNLRQGGIMTVVNLKNLSKDKFINGNLIYFFEDYLAFLYDQKIKLEFNIEIAKKLLNESKCTKELLYFSLILDKRDVLLYLLEKCEYDDNIKDLILEFFVSHKVKDFNGTKM